MIDVSPQLLLKIVCISPTRRDRLLPRWRWRIFMQVRLVAMATLNVCLLSEIGRDKELALRFMREKEGGRINSIGAYKLLVGTYGKYSFVLEIQIITFDTHTT